jgi:hypothetical protein
MMTTTMRFKPFFILPWYLFLSPGSSHSNTHRRTQNPCGSISPAPKARHAFKRVEGVAASFSTFFGLFLRPNPNISPALAPLHPNDIKLLILFIYIWVQVRVQVGCLGCKMGASWLLLKTILHPPICCFIGCLFQGASDWVQVTKSLAPKVKPNNGAGFSRFGCKGASCGKVYG